MKKSLIIHVVLMLAAIGAGSFLATDLRRRQAEIAPTKSRISATPLGGFHKFASDVEWMLFINYLGSLKSVDNDSVSEVVRRLSRMLSYDPNFEKGYEVGVMMSLSVRSPENAVKLLKMACDNERLKKNWKIPFYVAFILTNNFKDKNHVPDIQKAKESLPYFKMAIERSGTTNQSFIVNNYIRTKALVYQNEKKVSKEFASVKILYDIWKNAQRQKDDMSTSDLFSIPNIQERLLKAVKEAKENGKSGDKRLANIINTVVKNVFTDRHLCPNCLSRYEAGDKFCSNCGAKVKTFGVCKKCSEVLKGKFCWRCGQKN